MENPENALPENNTNEDAQADLSLANAEISDSEKANDKDSSVHSKKNQGHLPLEEEIDITRYDLDLSESSEEESAETNTSVLNDAGNEEESANVIQTKTEETESESQESDSSDDAEGDSYLFTAGIENALASWEEKSSRHEAVDAFKNGFVLPFLMILEFDVFDPDSVIPFRNGMGYKISTETQNYDLLLQEEDDTDAETEEKNRPFLILERNAYAMGVGNSVLERGKLANLAKSRYVGFYRNMGRPAEDMLKILNITDEEEESIYSAIKAILGEKSDELIEEIRSRGSSGFNRIPFLDAKIRRLIKEM